MNKKIVLMVALLSLSQVSVSPEAPKSFSEAFTDGFFGTTLLVSGLLGGKVMAQRIRKKITLGDKAGFLTGFASTVVLHMVNDYLSREKHLLLLLTFPTYFMSVGFMAENADSLLDSWKKKNKAEKE